MIKNNALVQYFKSSFSELKKVSWPSRAEVINHTLIVIISSAIAIGITAAVDYGLTYVVQYVIENRG